MQISSSYRSARYQQHEVAKICKHTKTSESFGGFICWTSLSENQIAANQVKGTFIPKTFQRADFSIQKIQSPLSAEEQNF